jgi:hypothetical protein
MLGSFGHLTLIPWRQVLTQEEDHSLVNQINIDIGSEGFWI